jgi:phage I-like protein
MASDICSGPTAPGWIQIFPFGTHETPKGTFVINAESLRLVMERAASHVNDYVADYEHATLTGAEAPAAGWITRIEARGAGGIWGRVQWTPRARALIEAREYRYFSPVFRFREHDRVVVEFLHGGLTNWPAFDGMVPQLP